MNGNSINCFFGTSSRITRGLSAVSIAWVLGCNSALAATDPVADKYGVYADFGNGGAVTDIGVASASVLLQDATGYLQGQAKAGPTLGVQANASTMAVPIQQNPPSPLLRTGAGIRIVDAYITGTAESTQAPINMFLDGALGVEVTPYNTPSGLFNNYAYIYVGFTVIPTSGTAQGYMAGHSVAVGNVSGILLDSRDGFGFLDSIAWQSSFGRDAFYGVVQSDLLTLPVNQVFELDINITAVAQTSPRGPLLTELNYSATAYVDFLHTLAFAAGTPVLALPDGYTFDAPSFGIANNMCSGAGCIAPVPELPAMALLSSGLVLMTAGRKRFRARGT